MQLGARFSAPIQNVPEAHPASCTIGTGSFPGVKIGRCVTLTPHPFWCSGQERVELYLYSPYGLYGLYRASVPVKACTLPYLFTYSPLTQPITIILLLLLLLLLLQLRWHSVTIVQTIKNTVNTSNHITKTPTHYKPPPHTPTHYKTHTYTHPHIKKPTHTHTHTLQNPHIHTPTYYQNTPTYTHQHTEPYLT